MKNALALTLTAAIALTVGCQQKPAASNEPGAAPAAPAAPGAPAEPGPGTASPAAGQEAARAAGEQAKKAGEAAGRLAPSAAAPVRRAITIPEGAVVKVRTTTAISTKTHNTGDSFVASLAEPLRVGDEVVAPKGATVRGRVVESDDGGRVKGRAMLVVRLTTLELNDGKTVDIATGTQARQAKSTVKKDALKVGIASGVGAAIGAIAGGGKGAAIGAGVGAGAGTGTVLATKGEPAVIPAESLMTFKLTAPAKVP
ncbi:MAG: hypothetical protein SFV54_23230 [Bryobacteraceae bacterium]|nr:hypothetical protein [Bryobacteraceae bacterium]